MNANAKEGRDVLGVAIPHYNRREFRSVKIAGSGGGSED